MTIYLFNNHEEYNFGNYLKAIYQIQKWEVDIFQPKHVNDPSNRVVPMQTKRA
jgi:hypothetical protein